MNESLILSAAGASNTLAEMGFRIMFGPSETILEKAKKTLKACEKYYLTNGVLFDKADGSSITISKSGSNCLLTHRIMSRGYINTTPVVIRTVLVDGFERSHTMVKKVIGNNVRVIFNVPSVYLKLVNNGANVDATMRIGDDEYTFSVAGNMSEHPINTFNKLLAANVIVEAHKYVPASYGENFLYEVYDWMVKYPV